MSDCQMGARKGNNNIFILNGINHETLHSKQKKTLLHQIYDYQQMFDSMDLEEAICDIFDAGVNDDTLALIYEANREVNTPSGLSARQTIKNIVLQGDTWGSILASVQVDTIGKASQAAGYGIKYKDSLPISLLGLVDDTIGLKQGSEHNR